MITNKHVTDFLHALDQELFFEAHEVLEEAWYPKRFENCNEVKLLKGFINAAVSFELIKRGRSTQSKTPWKTYLKYRQFLFKTNTTTLNNYYSIFLKIELIQKKLLLKHSKLQS